MNNEDLDQYQTQAWQEYRENAIKNKTVDIKEIDGQITISDPNNPINAELKEWLAKRGIDPEFYIEEEAKLMILNALQDPMFISAHVDEGNGLVIEMAEDNL
jgi:uncharacterized protein YhaN